MLGLQLEGLLAVLRLDLRRGPGGVGPLVLSHLLLHELLALARLELT